MSLPIEHYADSTARIAAQGNVAAGRVAQDDDTGNRYERTTSGWNPISIGGAAPVTQATLTSGEDQTNNVIRVENQFEYETVAAGQTAQVLGTTGGIGDLLHSIIITASTGTITVLDNAISVAVIPAAATGVWLFDLVSVSGAWKITTAASTSCTATGRFT